MLKPMIMIVDFFISPFRSGGFCFIYIKLSQQVLLDVELFYLPGRTDPFCYYKTYLFLYYIASYLKI